MKQFNFKFLVVMLLCLLQASGVCAQNFLNQHDENGKKHGQWVDTEIDGDGKEHVTSIEMYNHGKARDRVWMEFKLSVLSYFIARI